MICVICKDRLHKQFNCCIFPNHWILSFYFRHVLSNLSISIPFRHVSALKLERLHSTCALLSCYLRPARYHGNDFVLQIAHVASRTEIVRFREPSIEPREQVH